VTLRTLCCLISTPLARVLSKIDGRKACRKRIGQESSSASRTSFRRPAGSPWPSGVEPHRIPIPSQISRHEIRVRSYAAECWNASCLRPTCISPKWRRATNFMARGAGRFSAQGTRRHGASLAWRPFLFDWPCTLNLLLPDGRSSIFGARLVSERELGKKLRAVPRRCCSTGLNGLACWSPWRAARCCSLRAETPAGCR